MGRREVFDAIELDDVKIGEIDLAALTRAYKVVTSFISMSGEEKYDPALDAKFRNYILSDGLFRLERQLALRMAFEQMISMSACMDVTDRRSGFRAAESRSGTEERLQKLWKKLGINPRRMINNEEATI